MKKTHLQLLLSTLLTISTTTDVLAKTYTTPYTFNIGIQNTTNQTANGLNLAFETKSVANSGKLTDLDTITVASTYNNYSHTYPGFPHEVTTGNNTTKVGLDWSGASILNKSAANVGAQGTTTGTSNGAAIIFDQGNWQNNGNNIGSNILLANMRFTQGTSYAVVWDKFNDPKTGATINELLQIQGEYKNQFVNAGQSTLHAQYGIRYFNNALRPDQVNIHDPNLASIIFTNITINPTPEPEEYAMLLLGLPLIRWAIKRRKLQLELA